MKTTLVISSEEVRNRAMVILQGLPLSPVHELLIDEYKRDISADQRGLYFKWIGIIADSLGETKEIIHLRYKSRFLTLIFEKNPKRHERYVAAIQALRDLWNSGARDAAVNIRAQVIGLISIRDANVKEMAEYMTDVQHEAASLGIRLPLPEDQYNEAMGIKS